MYSSRFTCLEPVLLSSTSKLLSAAFGDKQQFGSLIHLHVSLVVFNSDGVRKDTLSLSVNLLSISKSKSVHLVSVWLCLVHSCFSYSFCWLYWGPDGHAHTRRLTRTCTLVAVLQVVFMGHLWWGSPTLYNDPRRLVSTGEALNKCAQLPSLRKIKRQQAQIQPWMGSEGLD